MIRLKLIPALLGATALTACAAGPNYKVPAPVASGQGAFVSAEADVAVPQAPPGDWWRLFQDPTLDGLVEEALVANKDVAVAAANLSRVRAVLSETRSGLLPSTTLSASGQRVREQDLLSGQFGEGDRYRAGFDMSYEVDLFGRDRDTHHVQRRLRGRNRPRLCGHLRRLRGRHVGSIGLETTTNAAEQIDLIGHVEAGAVAIALAELARQQ
ncbi:MAG TPA: hypothetical protein VM471_12015, partial [Phenylobacterium sp.]|nr:hypothetical protein [Phenylobacterium sp.]